MSKQFQFSRPVEYDPALAEAAQAQPAGAAGVGWSKADELKDEFGFESSEDEEAMDGQDGEEMNDSMQSNGVTSGGSGGGGGAGSKPSGKTSAALAAHAEELEAAHQEEVDRLADQLAEAQEARSRFEQQLARTEERMEELSAMSKQAKNILVAKFRQQLKVLMAQVEEQKAMLAEDDETLEALRAANAKFESGDKAGAEAIQATMKEFRDSRVQARENTTLRYKIEEMTQQLRSMKDELTEAKNQAEKAEEKVRSADGEDITSMKVRVEKLEAERVIFREEIKKRHLERTKLVAKLTKLSNGAPLDDLEASPTAAAAPAASPTAANGATSAASAAENAQLRMKIRNLEAALAAAQKAAAAAPAAAAASATPARAASAPSAPVGNPAKEAELNAVIQQMDELLKRRESELNEVKDKAKEKLLTASNAIKKLKTEYGTLREAYQKVKDVAGQGTPGGKVMSANLPRRKELLTSMKKACSATKQTLTQVKNDMFIMNADIPALGPSIISAVQKFIAGRANETQHLMAAYKKEMAERKKLFNQIQEMKGNIRVYCRVRPMNAREKADPENLTAITFPAEGEMSVQNFEKKTAHNFEFEKVFDPTKVQEEIFPEVQDLVVSVLDGYNVCIFAYGQTGSGKTYTMQGPESDPGVNTRALGKLFEVAAERFPDIKLLEIYNEKIQDLLGEKGRVLKAVQGQYGMEVQDLTMVSVANQKEVLDTLKKGSKNRSVTATNMNDVSSRSHLILSVYVMARNNITGKDTMGKLHLIDLAGSERVGRSGVQGEAMKEAQAINQSLSALGNVIAARANKTAHVPYRDSTLTYLLQDSLEKNSKTLMFVQVSPVKNDSSESICSLRFAERVRKVELGKAEAVSKKPKA